MHGCRWLDTSEIVPPVLAGRFAAGGADDFALRVDRYRSAVAAPRSSLPEALLSASTALAPNAIRRLELHEAAAHVHGDREMRDLGDAILLHDPRDRDPFLNRISGLRLAPDGPALDRRLMELLALFASLNRRPHFWVRPLPDAPAALAVRLLADGFMDLGGTFMMVLGEGAAAGSADSPMPPMPPILPATARVERLATAGGRRGAVAAGAAGVLLEAFGAEPGTELQIADDLARTTTAAWDVCLLSVGDVPVAAGRRYTTDGMTFLSSIATRPTWWGRGFGAAISAILSSDGRHAGGHLVHLGVEAQNARAQRLYRRLGFQIVGERVADLMLE